MLSGGKAFSSCHEVRGAAWKRWYCTKARVVQQCLQMAR